jgi:N-acetylglucosaminyldiphosphoundecaprenol N-acetyl-beta-D-mannosaminyltransferase
VTDPPTSSSSEAVFEVMGYPLWVVDVEGLIRLLLDRAVAGVRTRVSYLNAHSWNLARRNPEFRQLLLSADILYADGMSLVWASRLLGTALPARLSSADYVVDFARACASRGVSVYLLGGNKGVAERAAGRLAELAPGLAVVGADHGHFHLGETSAVTDQVNRARPDILLVGMGSPRQESWAATNGRLLDVPVVWTVGALFDYLAGVEQRAPQWMCRAGLEWLFRLLMDPKGKAGRYLVGNPAFAGAVLMAKLRQCLRGRAQSPDRIRVS